MKKQAISIFLTLCLSGPSFGNTQVIHPKISPQKSRKLSPEKAANVTGGSANLKLQLDNESTTVDLNTFFKLKDYLVKLFNSPDSGMALSAANFCNNVRNENKVNGLIEDKVLERALLALEALAYEAFDGLETKFARTSSARPFADDRRRIKLNLARRLIGYDNSIRFEISNEDTVLKMLIMRQRPDSYLEISYLKGASKD